VFLTGRWLAASQSNQIRFLLGIKRERASRTRAVLECGIQPFVQIADSNTPHTVFTAKKQLGNRLIFQALVAVQEHVGALDDMGLVVTFANQRDELIAFRWLEVDGSFLHTLSILQPRKIFKLSGGQKKLVGLAKLLIEQPELLLLDEPDNHLDLNGKAFLEKLIADYAGAVVIVSHDRYLLDLVAEEIVELEDGTLTHYVGNYSEYAFEKKQRLLKQQQMYEIQQREIQRLEFSIRRLMGWGAGQNEKFVRRARSMQKRLEKMDKVDKPHLQRKTMGVALAAQQRGSNKVLEINALRKSFDTNIVLHHLDLMVWHRERVGLIGPNGAGKTVLLRCILGLEKPDAGEITLGPSTTVAYYAQEHQTLDYDATLGDELRAAKAMGDRELYGLLGRFLFTPQDAQKKISQLSGGEKARVQIAKLMLSGANFLLLDEPTNNLDIPSSEVLEAALDEYDGTVLVISHDRYFLDNVVERIVELNAGTLTEYLGNYTYYLEEKARRARGEPTYSRDEEQDAEPYETKPRAKRTARGR
jgi:ATP-binding cassette subfamily F protein 3